MFYCIYHAVMLFSGLHPRGPGFTSDAMVLPEFVDQRRGGNFEMRLMAWYSWLNFYKSYGRTMHSLALICVLYFWNFLLFLTARVIDKFLLVFSLVVHSAGSFWFWRFIYNQHYYLAVALIITGLRSPISCMVLHLPLTPILCLF